MARKKEPIEDLNQIFESANKLITLALWITHIQKWYKTTGQIISSIFGAIIGSAWASMLIVYAYTGEAVWLKIFFGTLGIILVLWFQCIWIETLFKRPRTPVITPDMAKMDKPDTNDINLKAFSGYKNFKYRITDPQCPEYNKQFFLYPIYARLTGDGRLLYFKTTQIRQTTEEK